MSERESFEFIILKNYCCNVSFLFINIHLLSVLLTSDYMARNISYQHKHNKGKWYELIYDTHQLIIQNPQHNGLTIKASEYKRLIPTKYKRKAMECHIIIKQFSMTATILNEPVFF